MAGRFPNLLSLLRPGMRPEQPDSADGDTRSVATGTDEHLVSTEGELDGEGLETQIEGDREGTSSFVSDFSVDEIFERCNLKVKQVLGG